MSKNKAAVRISGVLLAICLALGGAVAMVGTGIASPTGKVESAYAATATSIKQKAIKAAQSKLNKAYKAGKPTNLKVTKSKKGSSAAVIKATWSKYEKSTTATWKIGKKTQSQKVSTSGSCYQVQIFNQKGKRIANAWVYKPYYTAVVVGKGTYTVKVRAANDPESHWISQWSTSKIKVG